MNGKLVLTVTVVVIICFFFVQMSTLLLGEKRLIDLDDEKLYTVDSFVSSSMKEGATTKPCKDCTTSTKKKRSIPPNVKPDGYFNGNPVKFKQYEEGWHSNVHCVGDNFGPESWKHRSCHFQNFCFDLHNQSWVLFTSPEQERLEKAIDPSNVTNVHSAFSMDTTLSIGGINQKWAKDMMTMEWFPQLRSTDEIEKTGYFKFLNDAALVPYHSMAGFNPGHLLWDDFLPLYTLMTMFQLLDKDLVLMRYKPKVWMWASCDRRWNSGARKPYCKTMLKKFLPLMGMNLDVMTTQENVNMTWTDVDPDIMKKTKYVCASNGAAGLGMLTDHGSKLHGWVEKDYLVNHNVGRGGLLYDFRNWMMTNINFDPYKPIAKPKHKIVFSVRSSSTPIRNVHFKYHMERIKKELSSKYDFEMVPIKMSSMSLEDQISEVSDAAIVVTMCGGGAVTGMFLPKGASLIVYYNEVEKGGNTKARLDWDLLNNLGYLRVHWLPRPQDFGSSYAKPSEADYNAFVHLIDHELDIISHLED